MKIEVGKLYKTREGKKARIYAVDGGGVYSIHGAMLASDSWSAASWDAQGRMLNQCNTHSFDIVAEWDDFEFDWSCLPKWADRWMAMDDDESWWAFGKNPILSCGRWDDYSKQCIKIPKEHSPKFSGEFKDSLRENPEYKEQK